MIPNIFTVEELEFLRTLPEVLQAEAQLAKASNVYFQVDLPESYHQILKERLNVDVSSSVPFRWIRGDTRSHVDQGAQSFDRTHLVYLTDGEGVFEIGEETYPITAGTGFVFQEGVHHQVTQTNGSSRLLLGPMSELGMAVGIPGILADGATDTIYIRGGIFTQAEYKINDGEWLTVNFPATVINTNIDPANNVLKIYFTTDVTLSGGGSTFTCGSSGIQFGNKSLESNGNRPLIIIIDTEDYPGFIQNGNEFSPGFNDVYVYNLGVLSGGSTTLASSGGWIGQSYYASGASNNVILSCIAQGDVSSGGGGIVGSNAGHPGESSGSLEIVGCIHLGAIGVAAGGIVGAYCGNVNISKCSELGETIDESGGGIVGASAGSLSYCTVTRCYSTGAINSNAGGIVGTNAGDNGTVAVAYCYSLGQIGAGAGGIVGNSAGLNDGVVTVFGSYSTGSISATGGGIFGSSPDTFFVQNCYTAGSTAIAEGFVVAGSATVPSGSYSEAANSSSGWNTANAAPVLGGPLTGFTDNWVSTGVDQPYELNAFGVSPYTLVVTNDGTDLVTSYAQTLSAGGSTSPAVLPPIWAYSIVGSVPPGITINADTGVVQTTAGTPTGTYTFVVRSLVEILYTNTIVTLTVQGGGGGGATAVPAPTGKGFDFETLNTINLGKRFIDERLTNPNIRFNSYRDYLRYRTAIANYAPK